MNQFSSSSAAATAMFHVPSTSEEEVVCSGSQALVALVNGRFSFRNRSTETAKTSWPKWNSCRAISHTFQPADSFKGWMDLEGVLGDADRHELLSVVASVHHQRASKMLDLGEGHESKLVGPTTTCLHPALTTTVNVNAQASANSTCPYKTSQHRGSSTISACSKKSGESRNSFFIARA
ncbi:hypothetical protein PRIPAC_96728 [Pristionchus pacificus]|uniref:Uncharacterized protein n=1 Tax=Pristionchus pacificus TaxID=54126 RepID=A0A2A6D2K2_PRIPA|nr:hypothetical protein PRIPAC_96728 [Pristionchus pacificus]|eukprot:PDM84702.1 hypothetical protein PRIPAC_33725 [Pristionchus pacificus]